MTLKTKKKLKKSFIDLLKRYIEENEILRNYCEVTKIKKSYF